MADINYLNPTSLRPEIGWRPVGAQAGATWAQNRDDYRNVLAQQMRLQAMAERERGIDLAHKEKDVPLRDLLRTGQMSLEEGKAPYQRELGATGAQAQIQTNRIQGSPEQYEAAISKLRESMSTDQWNKFQRNMSHAGTIVEQALQRRQQQGDMEAMSFVQQAVEQAKRAGIELPPYIMDPKSWEPLYMAAINTAKQGQAMQIQEKKNQGDLNVSENNQGWATQRNRESIASAERIANIRGNATVQAAGQRAKAKFSTDQRINEIVDQISSIPDGSPVPSQLTRELEFQLSREYEKMMTQGAPIRNMAPELQVRHLQQQQAYIRERMGVLGLQPLQPQGQQGGGAVPGVPQQGTQRPPLESFKK